MFARLVLLCLASATLWAETPSVFSQVEEMLGVLSSITGWKVQRKVPAEMLSQDKFRAYVDESLKDSASDKEVRAEELTLKMFGLVPQNYSLAKESAALVTEQAAAFYDYKRKRLYILENTTGDEEQRMALVHELAHALADQQHSLGRYMKQGSPGEDAITARQAVTEGQATWLTWAYLAQHMGGKPEVPPSMIESLTRQAGAEGEAYPVFTNAPLYIRESLVFPYTEGLRFQDEVYRQQGKAAFDQVFAKPPASTQQVLHARLYFDGVAPAQPKLITLEAVMGKEAGKFRTLLEGTLGEFDISALLRQHLTPREGADAAAHLRGGMFRLSEQKDRKTPLLTHATQWDSPQAAERYFAAYQRVLRAKWQTYRPGASSGTEVRGEGDSGGFVLRLEGDTVQAVEGLPMSAQVAPSKSLR